MIGRPEELSIFCADVGSIKNKQFGWAAHLPDGERVSGTEIREFSEGISQEIKNGSKVAVGLECPLFVPVRSEPVRVNAARKGEGNRSWSASGGAGALATGLVEALWVMNDVAWILNREPRAEFNWARFLETESVFLWEAFVTSAAKGKSHTEDAEIAVSRFTEALPDPTTLNAIDEPDVLSLVALSGRRGSVAGRLGDGHRRSLRALSRGQGVAGGSSAACLRNRPTRSRLSASGAVSPRSHAETVRAERTPMIRATSSSRSRRSIRARWRRSPIV